MTRTTEPRDAQIELDRAMEAADDRGMEMLANLFGYGTAAVLLLTVVWVVLS